MSLYRNVFRCPKGHERVVYRQTRSIGKTIGTYCTKCHKTYLAFSPGPMKEERRDAAKEQE